MKIPEWLYPFHGRDPSWKDFILAHAAGLLAVVGIVFVNTGRELAFNPIQWILMGILAWESAGGIAANLSRQTRKLYAGRPDLRWIYIGLQFVQPLIVFFAFNAGMTWFLAVWLFPVLSAVILNLLRAREFSRPLAGLLFAAGIIILTHLVRLPLGIEWFGYLYFAKIILSFNSHE